MYVSFVSFQYMSSPGIPMLVLKEKKFFSLKKIPFNVSYCASYLHTMVAG